MDYFRDAIGMTATPVVDPPPTSKYKGEVNGVPQLDYDSMSDSDMDAHNKYLDEVVKEKMAAQRAAAAQNKMQRTAPKAAPQVEQAAPQEAPKDYFRDAIGTTPPVAQAAPSTPAKPTDPNATPDAESWLGRRYQDVMGKQDQRFKDLPTVDTAKNIDLGAGGKGAVLTGMLSGNSDEGLRDTYKKSLGKNYLGETTDANGYNIIHYVGTDGKRSLAYVNKPGLDVEDVGRGVIGSLPYVATGGALGTLMKGAGVGVQTVGQGATALVTNTAAQLAGRPLSGSEQKVDLPEAVATGIAGAAGPALAAGAGALWRRIVTVPGLFDKATGTLTPRGIEAAKRAGIEPGELTPDIAKKFAETFAKTKDEAQAAVQATTSPFQIPVSKGQMTKDPYLLTQEEAMRRRLFGEQAQGVMNEFDKSQSEAIKRAALGGVDPSSRPGIGSSLNPDRSLGFVNSDNNPAVLGQNVRDGLKAAREGARTSENAAWDAVPKLTPTQAAMDMLPDHLERSLGNFVIDENTPVASSMVKRMGQFVRGENPAQVDEILKSSPVKDVDRMRRQLLRMQGSAQGEDARAAGAVYGAFNDWIDTAAEKALLSGDASAAAALKSARGFTKEVREIFSPQIAGRTSPAANRVAQVLEGADTPEGVINALLGSQGAKTINNGGVGALRSVKLALDKFAEPDVARQTWNDIRLAYWVRLVQGKNGELVGPTAMLNNIKTAFANQKSAVETLYQPGEIVRMRQFVRALEAVSYKPPNASGSGYTAVGLAKDMVGKFFEAFGLNSKLAQSAIEYTGVGNAVGGASARSAVSPVVRNINPNLAGASAASTNALARD